MSADDAAQSGGRGRDPAVTLLWVVLAVAAALRIWGISYGLPHVFWTDEYHEVMRAMELGAGGFNFERTAKGGFYLLLFVEYGLYFLALKIAGAVTNVQEFARLFVSDPTMFYLLGRITAALAGCLTVAFVYLLGRAAYRASAGVFAALFLAVNVLHVDLSHRVGVDVPMTLFAVMALYYGVRIASRGSRRDYVLAAVCAALAATTKLPGILVLLPLIIAHWFSVKDGPSPLRSLVGSAHVWIAFALFLLVWVATNPGIVVASDFFSVFSAQPAEGIDEAGTVADRPNLWVYYLGAMRDSMGAPLFIASLASVAYALVRRRPADIMLVAFGAANYAAISLTTSEYLYFPRYTLPIVAVLVVLAGRALGDLATLIPRWRGPAAAAVLLALCAVPIARSASYSHSLTKPDTRALAADWLKAAVPAGSRVLVEGGKVSASRLTAPIEETADGMAERADYWRRIEPRQAKYLDVKLAVHRGHGYRLELVKVRAIEPLEEYVDRGVRYFVVRPDYFVGSRKAKSGSADLLLALRESPRARLLARFDAGESGGQGPTIEIYEYAAGGAAGGDK